MTRVKNLLKGFAPLYALALLATLTASVGAEDQVPKFKTKGELEKKFISEVCVAILKAAHPTGVDPSLDKYKLEEPKAGRTDLTMEATYKGKVTRKTYSATIKVFIDSSNKDAWEVLRIEYSDNNNVPQNRKNLEDIVKKFNEK